MRFTKANDNARKTETNLRGSGRGRKGSGEGGNPSGRHNAQGQSTDMSYRVTLQDAQAIGLWLGHVEVALRIICFALIVIAGTALGAFAYWVYNAT